MATHEQNTTEEADLVTPSAPAVPPPARRGRIGLLLFGWVLFVVILAAAAGGAYYLIDQRLKAEHAAAEARVVAWEARITEALGDGTDGSDALEKRLEQRLDTVAAALRESIAALQEQLRVTAESLIESLADAKLGRRDLQGGIAAARTETAALAARLEAVERAQQSRADVMVALVGLARAANHSAPFPNVLDAFERATGGFAAPVLGQAARTGVPSWPSLIRSFPEAARTALTVQSPEPSGADTKFWDRVQKFLAGLVTIRPSREVSGDTPAARISQAEARLEEGDYTAALAALDRLPAPARESMTGWITSARLRLAMEVEIDRLLDARLGSGH